MEAKRTDLGSHATKITTVLKEACGAPDTGPLVRQHEEADSLVVSISCPTPLSRPVTTDLGMSERALRLAIPDAHQPRYWIGLHERWQQKGKHKIRFLDCGLRLYVGGEDEEVVQFLRLEWVAPTFDPDGVTIYDGNHAGHPHWHIDRSALIGPRDAWYSLETLTAPEPRPVLEDFGETTASVEPPRLVHDCSWLQQMHLPARAEWMRSEWNGHEVPGPHQCEPVSIDELARWWIGALRYFVLELPH